MLYGMEDEDEFGLVKKEKVNIKKILIVIAILIACFMVVFISFSVSYKIINKNDNNNKEMSIEVKTDNTTIKDNINDKKNNETKEIIAITDKDKKEENQNVYEGQHIQISEHDEEKIEKKLLPEFNENAQALIKDIYFSDEKQVYLTFDDGPSKNVTPQILDILKENDVQATFFVLGSRVDLYPDIVKREYNEGHYIANHGYSHKYSQIYENKDTVFQEYIDCENSIKNALENQEYNSYLFRFPGGSSGGYYEKVKSEARALLNSYGLAFTNWNCLTGDAENKKTKEACMEEMIKTKEDQNSIILLMHDANDKNQTVEALPEIIQYFKNEGYTFKTFYEIF